MAEQVVPLIPRGFIQGNTTLSMSFGYFKRGEVHGITAYPTYGNQGITLRVSNIRYRKFILPPLVETWIMTFDLANLGGPADGVVFEAYIAILD